MPLLPPSFIGTFVASIFATSYFIVWVSDLKLWTGMTRAVILGGPAFVLLTYSLTMAYVEQNTAFKVDSVRSTEYWMRIISQTLLALSLAFLGVNLGIYFILFLIFTFVNLIWSIIVFEKIKDVFWHEAANFIFCSVYTVFAFDLYAKAIDFERTYAAFYPDRVSFETRRSHLQGQILDDGMILALVVGIIMMNLIILVIRSPNILNWLWKQPSLFFPRRDA